MQGKQSTLSKFGISDQEPIGRHVLDPQVERFGYSHPCRGKQSEEHAVNVGLK
jgi:hypothetical protein